ncbi:hypothetical protein [Olleya namhaensis]|uniref:Uncharacterized protein n=1 Tax=Olleya namhaensis TaxID=1144750 RepID=A0A1I3J654_9FLAO|nr:hypothetical protein [Olleya namhaensis]SFI55717.1 hypothetical protein SAMN05443431_101269 [Olleya namhaensis]
MIIEILKYLSPVALLVLIWSIIQYFDKKKSDKSEIRRKEKIESCKNLQQRIGVIRYSLFEPHTEISKSAKILANKLTFYENETEKDILKIDELNLKINENSLSALDKKTAKKEQDILIESCKNRVEESRRFLLNESSSLKENLSKLPETINTNLEELNRIPIIGMNKIQSQILTLTLNLKKINNDILTEDAYASNGGLEEEFTNDILGSIDLINEIELNIYTELK